MTLDGRVVLVALAVALCSGCAFGCWPLGERRDHRTRLNAARSGHGLVIAEVALSAMLVAAAGLTARSLTQLAGLDPGFRTGNVLSARLTPDPAPCQPAARCHALYTAVLERLRALPGVTAAAAVNGLPLGGPVELTTFRTAAHPTPPGGRHPLAFGNIVTPGYFAALGIPLLQGRVFASADTAPGAPPVVIVSQATAQRLWPGQPALGQFFKSDGERQWRSVVGVVGDVRFSLTRPKESFRNDGIYSPYAQPMPACGPCDTPPVNLTLVVRTAPGHGLTAAALGQAVAAAAPSVALSRIEPLDAWVGAALRGPRSTMWLFALAAALALLLGAVGLYGVLAYQVAGRRREIGIRMALGARRWTVLAAVTGQGLRLALLGCALGLAAALLGARLLAGLLYGFNPRDPATYAAVAAVWLLVAALASALPARRACRVDPARALRGD
ncbi:MAG: FtsX-like permease family protein [Terriglobales bacterium]